jgi:hypothetical protein
MTGPSATEQRPRPVLACGVRFRRGPRRLGASRLGVLRQTLERTAARHSVFSARATAITQAAGGAVIGVADPDEPLPRGRLLPGGEDRPGASKVGDDPDLGEDES